ncbi:nSTAND3 domain-containing NTPase [Rhizobium rhizogenes]|uniref:Novel STAND NTPase 3 domain-containing protein n=1 Tax=Rhizobium rhizogenes NBRC 13257 TaxID=1220581 RepID=A0AA87QFD0_RHIRH|nr:AAA family ATPase [Rhizobium rhizogenes]NTG63005.1 AAA family ATPase [Rhizobium rhizogenes]NTG69513.1 AAA family ATPase [Rhizobium rhizogenes]NTG82466.1 AAA family ATPase [Rhizobium rhizogenes]NTH27781.1 AAA family ATPase [Rhizobium rhizogenes]NTH98208.1 AAA family ATPase [Rhizobium rhizogenes]
MSRNFSSLNGADFEDLVRDLIGEELGIRFEAFCAGPDGGIDGRHAPCAAKTSTILQAKHMEGSTFAALKAAMRKERTSIDKLAPSRYMLATSRPLTPANKASITSEIGPALLSESDILGPNDLEALLRKYPSIEKAHIKLWLSSAAILDRVVRSASHAYAAITKEEIEAKVKVYVQNPSFTEASERLEKHHLLIISGPPGVGKTTLGEMVAYAYLGQNWDLVPIRSLEDGFAAIIDTKKQVFLFDDFLGKIALDKQALASKDSDLTRFMNRVRRSPNARFILTTRAYIFEDARRLSENLADHRLDVTKYVLDVGVYARRIRARILYNHLVVASTPIEHVQALIHSGKIPEIVDHRNYNPRIIEWMTDAIHIQDIEPGGYVDAFLMTLNNPSRLWDNAFRTHIDDKCRHLLFTIFFCSEYGVDRDKLRQAYDPLHTALCARYGIAHDPKDFEEAIRTLEGGFINISGRSISYINPSVRDYMAEYLNDYALLGAFARAAQKADYAEAVWKFGSKDRFNAPARRDLALAFQSVAETFSAIKMWAQNPGKPNSYILSDIGIIDRLKLLLAWWAASEEARFAVLAVELAATPPGGFSAWRDGAEMIELLRELPDPDYFEGFPFVEVMIGHLEAGLIDMLNGYMGTDDLQKISDAIEEHRTSVSLNIIAAMDRAIVREIEEISDRVAELDSESTLNDHMGYLGVLGPRAGVPKSIIERAEKTVKERIEAIEEETTTAAAPEIGRRKRESETFDDAAIQSLFAPLLSQ